MSQFVLLQALFVSAGVVLYIMIRALPRVEEGNSSSSKKSIFEWWVASGAPEKVDAFVNLYLARFLRKMKISLMRFDNFLTERLRNVQTSENGSGKPKKDFSAINKNATESSSGSEAGDGNPPSLLS